MSIINISPMSCANPHFAIKALNHEVQPEQQYRELLQNGIDAIIRRQAVEPKLKGEVIFDHVLINGVKKIRVSDNGDGMTPDELVKGINKIFSSFNLQTMDGNFGIGGKITVSALNPHGVIYISKKNDLTIKAVLLKNSNEEYGLLQQEDEYGVTGNYIELQEDSAGYELLHECAREKSGTSVILLGHKASENTYDTASPHDKGLSKLLNSRYFTIQKNITVSALDNSTSRPSNRNIQGQLSLISKIAVEEGEFESENILFRWWILPPANKGKKDYGLSTGYLGVLYQNEVYTHLAAINMRDYGIHMGYNRIVLLIEPLKGACPNVSRSKVMIDGLNAPLESWESIFAKNIPAPIQKIVDEKTKEQSGSFLEDVQARLNLLSKFFMKPRRIANPSGDQVAEAIRTSTETEEEGGDLVTKKKKKGRPKKNSLSSVSGTSASQKPHITWTDDFTEDRIAKYVKSTNTLLINAKSTLFKQMQDDLVNQYGLSVRGNIIEALKTNISVALCMSVMGVMSGGQREWSSDAKDNGTSPEALTGSVFSSIEGIMSTSRRQVADKCKVKKHTFE